MIADLKPYDEYKDSGVSWLGKVPAHWQIVRSKRLFTARQELARPDDVQLSATQAYGVIAQSLYEERTGYRVVKISMHLDKRRHVERDDFIISMRSFQGGLERAWTTGAIRSSYVVLKPEAQIDAAYFRYLFKSVPYIAALRATGDFIRDGQDLNYGNFCGVDLPLISLSEQTAIGRFLNWANGRMDRTIRAKKEVIALLKEQQQAVIHRAVTRGLDPGIALKPSGIPWLGDIPQHWEVRRLKHLARFQSGDGITSLQIEETGSFPVYGGNGLRGYATRYTHDGDYALIGRQGALCGNINFASGKFFASEHAVVPTLQPGVSVAWFGELLRVMNLNQYSQSAAQPGLAVERIKNLYAPVPPSDEQQRLVESFERSTAPITTGISRLEREIDLLREYRARLVADVVTGQLDVREAAARMPEDAPPNTTAGLNDESDDAEVADEEAEA